MLMIMRNHNSISSTSSTRWFSHHIFLLCFLFVFWAFINPSTTTIVVKAQSSSSSECGVSRRVPWRSLTCQQQETFLRACLLLKETGRWDELVEIHFESGDWAHEEPPFLVWHRWYMTVFERELRRVIVSSEDVEADPCSLSIPFWDWDRESSIETPLRADTFGTIPSRSGERCVTDGIAQDWDVAEDDADCLIREFNSDDEDWDDEDDILDLIEDNPDYEDFQDEFESGAHRDVHSWVGGPMSNYWAPDDPLFLLHHSNVDRIFALWQNYWGYGDIPIDDYEEEHYHGDLDEPLVIRADRRVDMDRPGRDRPPTPRELLSNRGEYVNVIYEHDNLAMELRTRSDDFDENINLQWNSPGRFPDITCQTTVDPFRGLGDDDDDGDDDEDEEEDVPSPSPTPSPTLEPTGSPIPTQTPQIEFICNRDCNDLKKCQADCDQDSDCEGDLICFDREGNMEVPGCLGGASYSPGWDFCIMKSNLEEVVEEPPPAILPNVVEYVCNSDCDFGEQRLQWCKGDCDSDDNCDGNLVCFQRTSYQEVPGCSGGLEYEFNIDFCIHPEDNNLLLVGKRIP